MMYGKVRRKCPFCYEKLGSVGSRENASIDLESGTYKCYRCGSYGRLTKEIANKFNVVVDINFIDTYIGYNTTKHKKLFPITSFNVISPSYYYMKTRKIPDEVLDKFEVSLCLDGSMQGIVFPLLDMKKDKFVYRTRNGTYINKNIDRNIDIYNGQLLKTYDTLIIVEGPIDVIRLYPLPAIATLGKSITEAQLDRILLGCKNPIFALDSDAYEYTFEYVLKASIRGYNAYCVRLMEGKDPADYGYDSFLGLEIESLEGKHGNVGEFFES